VAARIPDTSVTRWNAILAVVCGALVVAGTSWIGVAFANGSRPWSPAPFPMILPAWLIGEYLLGNIDAGPGLIPYIGAALFLVVGFPLLSPRSTSVLPPIIFGGLVLVGSLVFFCSSWSYGIRWQGLRYTATLAIINLALALVAAWLGRNAYRQRTYSYRFAFTLLLCIWFVWFSFPWLGEMP